ncbi:MAG: methyltransferase domain-containing protein [Gemmataceae bacterium]|nr:methyltransferase domain-containing protein [Gemmataceae bacterium]
MSSSHAEILEPEHWDEQYEGSEKLPWETGRPAEELCRVVAERRIRPCRALELGCGTGLNAIWLASHGFAVTGLDLSGAAIRRAFRRAAWTGMQVEFRVADLTNPPTLEGPFDFIVDCGCYSALRLADPDGYFQTLERYTRPGTVGLVLVGNDQEPEEEDGPPVMSEKDVRREFGRLFDVDEIRPFRFDAPTPFAKQFLGWSCFIRRAI